MADKPTFEEAFHRMQQNHHNDIVHITNWMRDATTYYTSWWFETNNVPNTSSDDLIQDREPFLTDISDCDSQESADIVNEETYPESKFKRLFDGLDTAKIELHKFYEILGRVAEERKTNLETLKNKLVSGPNKYYKAMKEGYAAFSKSLKKVVGTENNTEKNTVDGIAGNVLKKSGTELADDANNVKENIPHSVRISSVEDVQIIESMSSKPNDSLSQTALSEKCSENHEKVSADVSQEDAAVKKRKALT